MFDATPTDVMDRWIEALESGRYRQCVRNQREGDAYCALGLLGKIADIPKLFPNSNGDPYSYKDMGELLAQYNVSLEQVYDMNDAGATFPKIAAWLRGHLGR